jgi:hypothetical protein
VRWVVGIVFLLGAVVLGLIFLSILGTGLGTGRVWSYFWMVVYGVGAVGCFRTGTLNLKRAARTER